MPTDDERLSALESAISGMRGDVSDLKAETMRTRTRLHDAEGLLSMLVEGEKQRRRERKARQERLELRIKISTVVILAATFISPFAHHFLGG